MGRSWIFFWQNYQSENMAFWKIELRALNNVFKNTSQNTIDSRWGNRHENAYNFQHPFSFFYWLALIKKSTEISASILVFFYGHNEVYLYKTRSIHFLFPLFLIHLLISCSSFFGLWLMRVVYALIIFIVSRSITIIIGTFCIRRFNWLWVFL